MRFCIYYTYTDPHTYKRYFRKNNFFCQLNSKNILYTNGNPWTTIISCYSPTNASDEMDVITFYNELSSLVQHIPKHNIVIISGDKKAQIGKDKINKFCKIVKQK